MKTVRLGLAVPLILLLAACASVGADPAELAVVREAIGVGGGAVPLPTRINNGVLQLSWNGTYAELLAADALAMCWRSQSAPSSDGGTTDPDLFLASLATKMTASACKPCGNQALTGANQTFCQWLDSRGDATCNMDAATGEQAVLDTSRMRPLSQTTPYVLPTAAALGMTGTSESVRNAAQDHLSYAELSLCMAQHLNQHLESDQVIFASQGELEKLQEMVRERALTATVQYSLIAKSLAVSWTQVPVASSSYYIPVFVTWGSHSSTFISTLNRIGKDFALAISLLIDASEASAELLLRRPDAQDSFGTYNDSGQYFVKSSRRDLLTMLYGKSSRETRAVSVDMSAPEVGVLLGLARRAGALKISLSSGYVNIADNAMALLNDVEIYLREIDCQAQGNMNPSCWQIPGGTDPASYLLWQRHRVAASHATTLVKALTTGLFGQPTGGTRATNTWGFEYSNVFEMPTNDRQGPAQNQTFHILGSHSFTGSRTATWTTGDVVLDNNFHLAPLRAHEYQSGRVSFDTQPTILNPNGDTLPQGFGFRGSWDTGNIRTIGSVTALAYAREGLVALAGFRAVGSKPRAMYEAARAALPVIENAIGVRQVSVRQMTTSNPNTLACSSCVTLRPTQTTVSGNNRYTYAVHVLTRSNDPITHIGSMAGVPHATTLAFDPSSVSIWGTSFASISATGPYTATTAAFPTVDNYNLRYRVNMTWDSTASFPHGTSVLLRRPGVAPQPYAFDHVFTGRFGALATSALVPGAMIAYGGRLNRFVDQAWEFASDDWSKPRYDGFGLPRDWTPMADAYLHGGAQGQPVEQFFLSRAKTSAQEATTALTQAFEALQQQSQDQLALDAAEERGRVLAQSELESVCGTVAADLAAPLCEPTLTTTRFNVQSIYPVGTCLTSPNGCQSLHALLTAHNAEQFTVAQEILDAPPSSIPTFERYAGGRLQSLLIDQRVAYRGVPDAIVNALDAARANDADVLAAMAEFDAAVANFTFVELDVAAQRDLLEQQGHLSAAQADGIEEQMALLNQQHSFAQLTEQDACSQHTMQEAVAASFSWPGVRIQDLNWTPRAYENSATVTWGDTDLHSGKKVFNAGPIYAAQQRCEDARMDTIRTWFQSSPAGPNGSLRAQIAAMDEIAQALNSQAEAQEVRVQEAASRREAARRRVSAIKLQALSQRGVHLAAIQHAKMTLIQSTAAIQQALVQAQSALARVKLDEDLASQDIKARFGLRQRFRSYDLWRARALSENARRMALAARSTIESRFVVDLGKLTQPEPFVDAPSLWANDIYSADLKPPVAVGLERSPIGNTGLAANANAGVYTNKLTDYVNNLELFVNGYAVERPTAEVRADVEVVQLPGPARIETEVDDAYTFTSIDESSAGWLFYCENNDTWIANPDSDMFTDEDPVWTLSTACGGEAPTKAKLAFWLDPWGRVQQWIANPPYAARHNVRWRQFAVNLVGAGIRDCARADDPPACYAEPFIRYDITHVGPALTTDYNEMWHSTDIARAFSEGAKALAAEEWLDPVSNGFSDSLVANVARFEFAGRPVGGNYELVLDLTPDVRVERIERIQLLAQTEYWVRQR